MRTEPSKAKLNAYKRHWKTVWGVRDELTKQYIHDKIRLSSVSEEAQLNFQTVRRFFRAGKGNGRYGYSLFHGPNMTTVIGIASAIGMEITLVPKGTMAREKK
ncbi:MAG: hypothetical protein EHM35_04410 [Planctomycetaceae bacterium]|nr:MAG: hypothetical protein EHM35_04410 [Planctomycetaceae bacterium]